MNGQQNNHVVTFTRVNDARYVTNPHNAYPFIYNLTLSEEEKRKLFTSLKILLPKK